MRSSTPQRHMIDLLFTLALFCVLAASSLLVVLLGADVYKGAAADMTRNYELRTSLLYVSEKIRQYDVEGAVSLGELDGIPALTLDQAVGETVYRTYIYHHDGALCEVFSAVGTPLSPGDGQRVTELAGFSVEAAGEGLLRVTCTGRDGASSSVLTGPRSR